MGLRATASICSVPKKYRPHGELFCFRRKKELVVLGEMVDFGYCLPVETLKACAVCGLHMMSEENTSGSSGSTCPDLGDTWRYGCPRSPDWDGTATSTARAHLLLSSMSTM